MPQIYSNELKNNIEKLSKERLLKWLNVVTGRLPGWEIALKESCGQCVVAVSFIQPKPTLLKSLFVTSLLLASALLGHSQIVSLTGKIVTGEKDSLLADLRVAVFQKGKPSIPIRILPTGRFIEQMTLETGAYTLHIEKDGYEPLDRVFQIRILVSSRFDFGELALQKKIDTLQTATVVRSEIRPKLRGDTVDYNTGNILLRKNANVEELLGRLPGLQVAPDGTITYNGEVIKQLLVDGEDFFGSDPTIVSKNFDASKIARVQIIERKSNGVLFSGIDDGKRTKTLNLVMKEDAKTGYFGKGEAGGGVSDAKMVYSAGGFLASLKHKQQLGVVGIAANTGATSVSEQPGGVQLGIIALPGSDDPLGASAGKGIPRFIGTAGHYANTWEGDANHLVGNYQFTNSSTRPVTTNSSVQTLPNELLGQNQVAQSVNKEDKHWGHFVYDMKGSPLSSVQLAGDFTHVVTNNQYLDTASSTLNYALVNRSYRTIVSNGNKDNGNGGIYWKVQSKKNAGRSFGLTGNFGQSTHQNIGYIYSINSFYQLNGQLFATDTVDLKKVLSNTSQRMGVGFFFKQTLWGDNALGITNTGFFSELRSLQNTFSRGDGKYANLVDSLSSHYKSNTINQSLSLSLQNSGKMLLYILGGDLTYYSFRQKDLVYSSLLSHHYWNISPRLFLRYAINKREKLTLFYQGFTDYPSYIQLQPVRDNSDPLHIALGNPDLKPSFKQSLNIEYTSIRSWMLHMSLQASVTSNEISTRTLTDTLGRQISQSQNVNGSRNMTVRTSVNKKIGGLDMQLTATLDYLRSVNFVNADVNQNNNFHEIGSLGIRKSEPNKYSIQVLSRVSHVDNMGSLNAASNLHYWTRTQTGSATFFRVHGFEINTTVDYNWQQAGSVFAKSIATTFWNASVTRNFLDSRMVTQFSALNILNENNGISRGTNGNTNSQSVTNVLGRNWMLSLIYHFDHKPRNK